MKTGIYKTGQRWWRQSKEMWHKKIV